MNYEIFSQRLKDARSKKQLTQRQLADKIGVSATTLTNYETNKSKVPGADVLVSLSKALDVSIDWLLGNEIASEKASNKSPNVINREDIQQALNVLFSAFADKISLIDYTVERNELVNGYPNFYEEKLKAILVDEANIQKYFDNYVKLSSVSIDKAVLQSVFDAIFPKGRFITFAHSFEYYESPFEDEESPLGDNLPF